MRFSKKVLFAFCAVGTLLIGIVAVGLFLSTQKPQGRFGVYLSQNNQVVLTDEDIFWYNKSSHQMKLTEEGKNKLEALTIELRGTPFTMRLKGREIYNGSFMTPVSSFSCSGIVIEVWQDQETVVKIENGYPSSQLFTGTDPRDNSELLEYFQKMGKLTQ